MGGLARGAVDDDAGVAFAFIQFRDFHYLYLSVADDQFHNGLGDLLPIVVLWNLKDRPESLTSSRACRDVSQGCDLLQDGKPRAAAYSLALLVDPH